MSSFCKNCGKWKAGDLCAFCGTIINEDKTLTASPGLMHCPGCNRWVDINEPYCPACGKEIAVKEKVYTKVKWEFKPKTAREGMTHCMHCNKRVSTAATVCPTCGKNPAKPFNETPTCPSCSGTLSETALFCPHCGIKLNN